MRRILVTAVLAIVFLSPISHAATIDDFRSSAKRVLREALKQGLTQLDGIDLKYVLDRVDKVEITLARTHFANRTTALWRPMKVAFNPEIYQRLRLDVQDVLPTHEMIGAITGGWKDDGYGHALYIWMVANRAIFRTLLSRFEFPTNLGRHILVAGGTTVVGGGGDGRDIKLKIDALLCLNSALNGGACFSPELNNVQIPIDKFIKGILFANWYVSSEYPEGNYNIKLPNDRTIQPVALIHPKTYDAIIAADDVRGAYIIFELAEVMGKYY